MASQELNQALWNAANVMRSTMSADEYKNYLLGLVFYKWESTKIIGEWVRNAIKNCPK